MLVRSHSNVNYDINKFIFLLGLVLMISFIIWLITRLETVNVKKVHSLAKVIGTVITVSGAMIMTLYKGPIVDIVRGHANSTQSSSAESSGQHWILGPLMLIASCGGWASFFIVQVSLFAFKLIDRLHYMLNAPYNIWRFVIVNCCQSFTLKKYPAQLSLTAWICAMGVLEGGVVTLVMERKMSVWVIGWDSRLLASVYSVGSRQYIPPNLIRRAWLIASTN